MSVLSQCVKIQFGISDFMRDFGLKTPDDIIREDDYVYGDDPLHHVLDIYYPRQDTPDAGWPIIISVHGGAWVYGDKEKYQYYCMDLARRGFCVINFTYRLAPKFTFENQIKDLNAVVLWLYNHRLNFPVDLNNIFMVGDSAGAYLLSLYICLCSDEKLQSAYGVVPQAQFKPKAIGLNCGAYHIDFNDKGVSPIHQRLIQLIFYNEKTKHLIQNNRHQPLDYITEAFPPAFVMTANNDFLRSSSYALVDLLKSLELTYVFKDYGDSKTPLRHVFHLNIKDQKMALQCNNDQCDFFKRWIN